MAAMMETQMETERMLAAAGAYGRRHVEGTLLDAGATRVGVRHRELALAGTDRLGGRVGRVARELRRLLVDLHL